MRGSQSENVMELFSYDAEKKTLEKRCLFCKKNHE